MSAEMIVTNARVLTMDEGRPRAEAVAVASGRILAVGSAADIAALAGPQTRVIDAGGRTLLPGFVESHLHLVLGGNELSQLQLDWMQTVWATGLLGVHEVDPSLGVDLYLQEWLDDELPRFTADPPKEFNSSDSMSPAMIAAALETLEPTARS